MRLVLLAFALNIRRRLRFAPDTAAPGTTGGGSAGHCAAAAVIVRSELGGDFVSVRVDGRSHWYNRVGGFDIDVTGDQFGRHAVQVGANLYPGSRVRHPSELTSETLWRARELARRSGFRALTGGDCGGESDG
ncbi:MAG: hypothetical protein A3F76_08275 [Burkholderiales bacterium RIFCSPLOWO2_12_FULL_65_40]|nr:MAG: hypothetical protein A3F76_08275 [Burkholderiales bacterium RIFCSPLOWO2_12_FULL_65_40]